MTGTSRREFFKNAGIGALCAGALKLSGDPLGLPIGCQTYPARAMIGRDFPGTIKQLAAAGFQSIELCSPVGYADSGFTSLAKYKGSELRKILTDIGVTCKSSHFSMAELRQNLSGRITWAKELGLTQMMVPSLEGPRHPTMDDVKRVAEEYNKIAEQSAGAGIQQGLHNEDFELSTVNGKRTYDVLFDVLHPKLVKFQFQISTISRGYEAVDYFTRYPGRFISMHVQGWSAKTRQIVPVGQGTLNWKEIFTAAKAGGIKNYFVEMDLEKMRASVPYLRNLQV
ncbi:MAG: sugar phosphate isomerase/epimerase family protein [Bryobacteraceae bacterium]